MAELEKVKGYQYRVKGSEDLNEFAKGVLALVNVKSSKPDTIIDIRTWNDGSNDVDVIVYADTPYKMDEYLKAHFREIISKDEIEIVLIDSYNLEPKTKSVIRKIDSDYLDEDGKDYVVLYKKDYE